MTFVCGVDEAGRGPLAGPVYAAAVILSPSRKIEGLADSKKLSEARRVKLAVEIREKALAWCVGTASVEEIDEINILQASLLAMKRAVEGLAIVPTEVLVDGTHCPKIAIACRAIIKGDSSVAEISAASILAKTERDFFMLEMDKLYPQYGFVQHKGYPTKMHCEALMIHGVSPLHRKSFGPVKEALK